MSMIAVQDTDVRRERAPPKAKITIDLGHGHTTRVQYGKAFDLLLVSTYKVFTPAGTIVKFAMAPDAESLAKTISVRARRDVNHGRIVDVGDYEIHREIEYNYRKESDGYDEANAPTYDVVWYYCPREPGGGYASDDDSDRVVVKKGVFNRRYEGDDWVDVFVGSSPSLKNELERIAAKENDKG